ncbi:MAG: AAA family ATPase [Gemmatimonas sp.]
MKIKALRIHNFRGIGDLELKLEGESMAILGPNGTGKSSIVDAIDFLVRGGIRRLEGEGAGELSLTKHGAKLGQSPQDSWVEADLVPQAGAQITARRSVNAPSDLQSTSTIPTELWNSIALAQQGGHHLLTRRELLKFVFTEPSNRANAVGALLQLDGVESTRKNLQGASREASNFAAVAKGRLSTLTTSVQSSFTTPLTSSERVEDRVNALRAILSGPPIDVADSSSILSGLKSPIQSAIHPLQSARNQSALRILKTETLEPLSASFGESLRQYLIDVSEFREDLNLQHALRSADLIERGLALLSHDECPLCLVTQSQEHLKALLDSRATQSQSAVSTRQALENRRIELVAETSAHSKRVSDVMAALSLDPDLPCNGFALLLSALERFATISLRSLDDSETNDDDELDVVLDASQSGLADIVALRAILQGLPETTQLQSAWDQLSQYSRLLGEQQSAVKSFQNADAVALFLKRADECFLASRDAMLQATYDAVTARMAELYRKIHGSDEESFAADMTPTRAGLKLSVEFRSHGRFPPSALHSEGHQDSMGLCFFLALSSHLAGNELPFVVLDDVVMSVDYGHRRGVADLLASEFSDRQLVVTTHDRVWWRQLRTAGVVSPDNSVEIVGWTLEDGPKLAFSSGATIGAAREALSRGNAPQAAHALRRAVEENFPEICDALGASVRYRGDGANDAGDFVQAAIGRLRDLVGKARSAAQEWKLNEEAINTFAERRTAACADFSDETWLVNPTVHFNNWTANLSVGDLKPVVESYEKLLSLFSCDHCKSILTCVENGRTPTMLRCHCTRISFNLEKPIKKK